MMPMMGLDWTMIVLLPAILLSFWAQMRVKNTFALYSRISSRSGMTAREAARRILDSYGLNAVPIREIAGSLTDEYDTEDWCHIGYHLKAAGQIGTVFFLDCRAPSYGRSLETVAAARGIGRPTLVITNGPLADLPEGAAAVQMPLLEEQPAWLAPLFDYAAPAILSGYCSELRGKGKFARQLLVRQQIIRRLEAARNEGGARDV